MSFSFIRSTSHRPDDEHLDEEEDDDVAGQMPVRTSGGVRAFSHLPVPKKPWQDAPGLQELLGGGGRERPVTQPEADNDFYRKPLNHRREDDLDFYKKKKPDPLLDELQQLEENEGAGELRPPARSGSVRAFSHLPERREAEEGADAGADTYTPAEDNDTRSWHPGHGSPEEGDDADHEQQPASDSGRSFAASPQEPGFVHPQDARFAEPSAQGWGQSGHAGSFASPSPSAAPGPYSGSSLPQGRLLEQRLPPGALSGIKGPPPALFKTAAETRYAAAPSPFAAKAAAPAKAAAQTQPNQAVTAAAKGTASTAGSTALEPANRVRRLDETVPDKPEKPKKSRRSPTDGSIIRTPDEQFAREMAAYEREKAAYEKALVTAADNHEANEKNKQTLKAWENYDRAIQMMENAPEGRKVLAHLRNDKTRVFRVVMVNDPGKDSYKTHDGSRVITIKPGAQGQYVNTGDKDENGREIHVLFLTKPALEGGMLKNSTLKPDGTTNPDAVALETVWHELYHAYERHTSSTGGVDPLGLGTHNQNDRLRHQQQAHEKRAVRFENLIRKRNGGTRVKDMYGGEYYKENGVWKELPPIPVPEPLPKFLPLD